MTKLYFYVLVALLLNILGRLSDDYVSCFFFGLSFCAWILAFIWCWKNKDFGVE